MEENNSSLLNELEKLRELIEKNNEQNKESFIVQDWNGNIRVFSNKNEMLNYIESYKLPLYTFQAYSFSDSRDNEEDLVDDLPKLDISTLKKRIKHAKNPMEKRLLQQQLNTAYKDKSMERKQNNRRGKR